MIDAASTSALGGGRRLGQLAHIDVAELHDVGTRRAGALRQMGIDTVLDLLTHYPRRYADRTNSSVIGDLEVEEEAVVVARVASMRVRRPRNMRPIVEVTLEDGTGTLTCMFFNQPWRARQLGPQIDEDVVVFGKVEEYKNRYQMVNPLVDTTGTQTGQIVAIYPQSGKAKVSSPDLGRYVTEALERAGTFAEPLDEELLSRLGLISRTSAFHAIHQPADFAAITMARRRLVFDELFRLQLALVLKKNAASEAALGIAHVIAPKAGRPDLVTSFLAGLAYTLTEAQRRVIGEIARDLASSVPMHRLLQGDVGSGKTLVAIVALLYGVQGGHQGAFMVPTEVLAEQHAFLLHELLEPLEVLDATRLGGRRRLRVELLTAKATDKERTKILAGLQSGAIDIVVGTHALITSDVTFSSLGVVVVDEQHRFGVDQRAALREKGSANALATREPDLLVMTATPIPRTAAMTVYGDLDQSVLDEMPKGRLPVKTRWFDDELGEERAWTAVRAAVRAGHQAFVICPLVRAAESPEDEALNAGEEAYDAHQTSEAVQQLPLYDGEAPLLRHGPKGAVEEAQRLSEGPLAGLHVGLLHGQLPRVEKQQVMERFRKGEISVLVATTVIEVGVDIANATVIVIEDADRFGIAQLHQLRGRVGRAAEESACYLISGPVTKEAQSRLDAMRATNDGFALADVDLELRGEGTVLGTRQKGRNDLKLASLARDRDLVVLARTCAEELVASDPGLQHNALLNDELRVFVGEEEAEYLLRS